MNDERIKKNRHAFWQALIVAILIFWTGILVGTFFESTRANGLESIYLNVETDVFDVQLENSISNSFAFDCDRIKEENIAFADRIFFEAKELEKYDARTEISDDIFNLHRRYDLLRVMLWNNIINLKTKCSDNSHTLVYLYRYQSPEVNLKAKQSAIGNVLLELKDKYPDQIILIPIASDTNVRSLNLLIDKYNLPDSPVIFIDENKVVKDVITFEELEKKVFN